jgi:hypothetical protein
MLLNAIGAYGFLAKAQIEHTVLGDAADEARAAQIKAKADVQAVTVADLDRRIDQIDRAVDTATARGRTRGAMNLAADQRSTRTDLVRQRGTAADGLAEFKAQEAGIVAHRRIAAADLGPVRYLAEILGVPADDTLRWFVLLVAMLLDPAAVLLLLTASRRA